MTKSGHLASITLLASFLGGGSIAQAAEPESTWRLHLQLATTAISANQVLPAPFSLGVGIVAERGALGLETGYLQDGATICDNPSSGGDGFCGWLLVGEVGPRLRLPVTQGWAPYLSAKAQWLRMTRADSASWAIAPRVGLTYDGAHLGGFIEVGASVVLGDGKDNWRLVGIATGHRVLPVLVGGLRL